MYREFLLMGRIRETIITHGCFLFFFFFFGGMVSLIKVRTLDHREFDYDRTFVTSTINSRKWSAAWRDENEVIAFSCALTRKRFRFWHGVPWKLRMESPSTHVALSFVLQMSQKSIRRKVKKVINIGLSQANSVTVKKYHKPYWEIKQYHTNHHDTNNTIKPFWFLNIIEIVSRLRKLAQFQNFKQKLVLFVKCNN